MGAALAGAAPALAPGSGPVGYRADGCRLGSRGAERQLTCKGNVKLWRSDLSLACDTLSASFDAAGNLQTATCTGAVQIVSQDAVAQAQTARFDGRTNQVELTGKPQARQRGSMVTAPTIRLDVGTGVISTEGGAVTGVIVPGTPAPPPPSGPAGVLPGGTPPAPQPASRPAAIP
jgi:lipopolysaccharide transport protein LptA